MIKKKRIIDHIVYAVPDLEKAILEFENKTGVSAIIGGRHLTKGTKNALVNLGESCYLEFLSVDLENPNITAPRWMGIDLIKHPKITRWCIKSNSLKTDQKILREYQLQMGKIEEGNRMKSNKQLLKWQMILPLAHPEVEIIPFCIDWNQSEGHPSDDLTSSCRLNKLSFYAPSNHQELEKCLRALSIKTTIAFDQKTRIEACIVGHKGEIII